MGVCLLMISLSQSSVSRILILKAINGCQFRPVLQNHKCTIASFIDSLAKNPRTRHPQMNGYSRRYSAGADSFARHCGPNTADRVSQWRARRRPETLSQARKPSAHRGLQTTGSIQQDRVVERG